MESKEISKPVGIKDVARYAGVSISTVSNVLNGKRAVRARLRERVQEAINQLEYVANPIGRQLKTGRSQQVALVVPSLTDALFPSVLKGLQSAADAAGYMVSVFATGGSISRERRIIDWLRSQRFECVFLDSCADADVPETADYLAFLRAVDSAQERPIRVICAATAISPHLDTVVVDDAAGVAQVTEHLLRGGRRHPAYIALPAPCCHAKARRSGFLSALAHGSLSADEALIEADGTTCRSGYETMAHLLDAGRAVDAVVCGSDQLAIGALHCLEERGVQVPEEVAVAGFGDTAPASLMTPSLTTVRVPWEELGRRAFALFHLRDKPAPCGEEAPDDGAEPRQLASSCDEEAPGEEAPLREPTLIRLDPQLIIRHSTDSDAPSTWAPDW